MFTDRFILLPIKSYNSEYKDLGMKDIEEVGSIARVLPENIESYFSLWKDEQEVVQIVTTSGDLFCTYITLSEFEKLLNDSEVKTKCITVSANMK